MRHMYYLYVFTRYSITSQSVAHNHIFTSTWYENVINNYYKLVTGKACVFMSPIFNEFFIQSVCTHTKDRQWLIQPARMSEKPRSCSRKASAILETETQLWQSEEWTPSYTQINKPATFIFIRFRESFPILHLLPAIHRPRATFIVNKQHIAKRTKKQSSNNQKHHQLSTYLLLENKDRWGSHLHTTLIRKHTLTVLMCILDNTLWWRQLTLFDL